MSIIEKALEKLEKADVRGVSTAATPPGNAFREAHSDSLAVFSKHGHDDLEPLGRIEPTTSKSSRHVEIDLNALQRAGYLTPTTMDSMRAEQYRRIKRPLLVRAFQEKSARNANMVLVTSSIAGEGKSYSSLNLAMSVASELDRTVLLVDADVFKHSLTSQLGLDNEPGLTDFLKTAGADLSDYLLRTSVPNLVFLPAGRAEHQLTELWASERMNGLMAELASRYSDRLVMFDSPPVLEQTSTAVLASMVGQVLMVVEAEKTPQHVVREALHLIGSDARVGLVFNKSNQRYSSEYGYGYYQQK